MPSRAYCPHCQDFLIPVALRTCLRCGAPPDRRFPDFVDTDAPKHVTELTKTDLRTMLVRPRMAEDAEKQSALLGKLLPEQIALVRSLVDRGDVALAEGVAL